MSKTVKGNRSESFTSIELDLRIVNAFEVLNNGHKPIIEIPVVELPETLYKEIAKVFNPSEREEIYEVMHRATMVGYFREVLTQAMRQQ